MPFVSDSQRRWMFSQEPEMAKRWAKHTPKGKKLPEKKEKTVDKKAFVAGMSKFFKESADKQAIVTGGLLGAGVGALANPEDRSGGAIRGGATGSGIELGAGVGGAAGLVGGAALGSLVPQSTSLRIRGPGGWRTVRNVHPEGPNPAAILAAILGAVVGSVGGGTAGGVAGHALGSRIAPPKEDKKEKKAGFEYGLEVFCKQNGLDKAALAKLAEVDDVVAYLQSVVNA